MSAVIWRSDVHAELVGRAPAIERRSPTAWRLDLDRRGRWLDVRTEAGWLLLDAEASPGDGAADVWELLSETAGRRGGVKLALTTRATSLRRRAELRLDGGGQGGFGAWLDLVLGEFSCGWERAGGDVGRSRSRCAAGGDGGRHVGPDARSRGDEVDLGAVVEELGWERSRSDVDGAAVCVDLNLPGLGLSAAIAGRADAADVLVRVDLEVDPAMASPEGRRAAGLLFLRANSELRSVRACPTVGGRGAALEVSLAAAATPAELHHALGALSVASSRLFHETHHLLGDPALARRYLASQGATPLLPFERPLSRPAAGGSRHGGDDPETQGGKQR